MRLFICSFGFFLFSTLAQAATPSLDFLDRLRMQGKPLNVETLEWMEKWRALDLEQQPPYSFGELSGATSVNFKVRKADATDPKGYKSRGTFVARNSAANPNTELAYFNLAAAFGMDHLIRPAARYELGPKAAESIRKILQSAPINHAAKKKNKVRMLAEIAATNSLKGCLKAKKPDSAIAVENISAVRAKIQAGASQPVRGNLISLRSGYTGDEYVLARELSILMTFDAVFGQWDRFSGGNIGIRLDQSNWAHFYFTDNGGATLSSTASAISKTLRSFSRYDRSTIDQLRVLHGFLAGSTPSYAGYYGREEFIVALGLYFENSPAIYVERVKRNIEMILQNVGDNERRYGVSSVYFN